MAVEFYINQVIVVTLLHIFTVIHPITDMKKNKAERISAGGPNTNCLKQQMQRLASHLSQYMDSICCIHPLSNAAADI